ncbi:nuclear transport factor 2 family protein [Lysobacter sp. KIS68-7]|uniref:nuclear transport factor 2 family protein n=1 Tax=Lysobacter sp. KIS68-7 TaxID=2904252 RepID=UPI001E5EE0B5|nr:nuclear transport factor 2 family protein [Lysobacter sp. KIS68-7]UHQ19358.1 nuclear transport factor 2 family protein [Lysobacter sp. KIS68-7]
MKITLPTPIELYLQADAGNDERLFSVCFAADAEVRDEGRTIRGLDAIIAWKREAKQKYQYRVEPLAASQNGNTVLLIARLTGNFPGSPVELAYTFELRANQIVSLEIR